jgi:phage terminase small subunit
MTPKQLAFAKGLLRGMTGSDAYRAAYPDSKADSGVIARKAYVLSNHKEIMAYVAKEKAKLNEEEILTKRDMLQALGKIVHRRGKDARASSRDVTAAVAQASRMLGCDAPSRVEVKLEGSLLHRIRAGKQAS